jgi:hypothetical protein
VRLKSKHSGQLGNCAAGRNTGFSGEVRCAILAILRGYR